MVYLSLLGNNAYHKVSLCISVNQWRAHKLTLNIGNALLKDLVEGLGVLELLLDLGNDALGKLLLLADLDLALVADPGVKNSLGLSRKSSLLLGLVGLGLELGGLLFWVLANAPFLSPAFFHIPVFDVPWRQRRGPWWSE
jgi:hypothetical protein